MATQLRSRLDYADLAKTPSDGRRYELLDGALKVSPSATPLHQRVSKRLLLTLVNYFESSGLGEVFAAPTDVILTARDVFVPDLVVVTQPAQVSARAIEGPPALIVEILSPTNAQYDRVAKARRYATLGVSHYWIVDPRAQIIECYRNVDGRFVEVVVTSSGAASFSHPDFEGLWFDTNSLWEPTVTRRP